MLAPAHKLTRLMAVVDSNGWQATGRTADILALHPIREKFEAFAFAEGVEKISDLEVGAKLPGIVTNVTDFGAFLHHAERPDNHTVAEFRIAADKRRRMNLPHGPSSPNGSRKNRPVLSAGGAEKLK